MPNDIIYRGYTVKINPTGRYHIYKDNTEIYSMTSTEDEMYAWIDKHKRENKS